MLKCNLCSDKQTYETNNLNDQPVEKASKNISFFIAGHWRPSAGPNPCPAQPVSPPIAHLEPTGSYKHFPIRG